MYWEILRDTKIFFFSTVDFGAVHECLSCTKLRRTNVRLGVVGPSFLVSRCHRDKSIYLRCDSSYLAWIRHDWYAWRWCATSTLLFCKSWKAGRNSGRSSDCRLSRNTRPQRCRREVYPRSLEERKHPSRGLASTWWLCPILDDPHQCYYRSRLCWTFLKDLGRGYDRQLLFYWRIRRFHDRPGPDELALVLNFCRILSLDSRIVAFLLANDQGTRLLRCIPNRHGNPGKRLSHRLVILTDASRNHFRFWRCSFLGNNLRIFRPMMILKFE